jgi:sulfoxide reductase heme-binding subunit YedZ
MGGKRPPTLYVALIAAAAVAGAILWANSATDWDFLQAQLLSRATGWCAAAALLCALFMTPLGRLFETSAAALGRTRRALGISAALLASLHAALSLDGPLEDAWEATLTWPWLRAGLTALIILLVLLATSFPRLTRALRVRVWKPLHRLSYLAGALVVLHLFHAPFAPRRLVAAYAALLLLAIAARLLPRRRQKRSTPRA